MDGSDTLSGVDGIAVIGMSCRFPGARNVDEFWRNLRDGVESVTFFSDQELRDSGIDPAFINDPNYVKAGCVIEDIDLFDATFFGYSPKEAETIDPQQRLFLECAWGAIEDAGYIPQTYEGLIGVFGGARMSSYVNNMSSELSRVGTASGFQALIGNDKDYITTRVSYKLNLRGPSVAVQSACSTSLVAVHLACESLRNEECDMALAGGVAMSVPQKQGYFYQEGMIFSPDGHCRAFDAKAQGIIGGNGVGIVLLKRLPDAFADGDHIYAVIKGSAVNNDGWSKVGYTAPSLEGQTAVISEALAMADVGPETITYIEAHGTGTELGDPMEVEALTRVFRTNTDKKGFCALGSVKTNFGHLDTAAGVASLIKTVLALKYKQLPPSLHFEKPNPRIDFPNSPFFVNRKLSEWKADGYPRRAGVSSFGIGGTNAHVVLEEAPALHPRDEGIERPMHLMTLSARSESALHELACRYESFLKTHPDALLADVCFTANVGRSHFPYRLAVAAESTGQLREQMAAFAAGPRPTELISGHVQKGTHPKVAFLFTGEGSQYVGMGRQLYYTQPTFRKALDLCAEILKSHLDRSLLSVIFEEEGNSSVLDETAYTQPALFALEYALAEMWRSWGIEPSVVMGHSVGEYVAACVAGVFSLEDGLKLIAARGRLIQALPQKGEMAAVFAGEERVAVAIAPYAEEVSIAAVNGPENVVISGAQKAVRKVLEESEREGIRAVQLKVSHALHSPLMEPVLAPFEEIAAEVEYSSPRIGLISNVTGQPVENNEVCEASYWRRHVREPVRFALGIETLHELGYEMFLEIGPSPVLLGMGKKCLPEGVGVWLPSFRKGWNGWKQILESLGRLYIHGLDENWAGFDKDYSRSRVSLPTYPLERKRYWIERSSQDQHETGLTSSQLMSVLSEPRVFTGVAPVDVKSELPETMALSTDHPLLGKRLSTAVPVFETQLSCNFLPYMKDHKIYGKMVVAGTVFFEMVRAAASEVFETKFIILKNLTIHKALILPNEDASQTIQVIFTLESAAEASFNIFSRMEFEEGQPVSWTLHSSGKVYIGRIGENTPMKDRVSLEEVQNRCGEEVSITEFYKSFWRMGFNYGTEFQGVKKLWRQNGEALGEIELPKKLVQEAGSYRIHPVMLDSCLQISMVAIPTERFVTMTNNEDVYMLVGIEHIQFYQDNIPRQLWSHARLRQSDDHNWETFAVDYLLYDMNEDLVGEIIGMNMQCVRADLFQRIIQDQYSDLLYEVKWEPKASLESIKALEHLDIDQSGSWILFADQGGIGHALEGLLEKYDQTCFMVFPGKEHKISLDGHSSIDPADAKGFMDLFQQMLKADAPPCRGIVHLWGLDATPTEEMTVDSLKLGQLLGCGSVLHLIQAMARARWTESPGLYIVTRGTQSITSKPASLAVTQAPLWGLGKVIRNEHPEFNCRMIDIDLSMKTDDVQALWAVLRSVDQESQVVFRNGAIYVPRLVRSSLELTGGDTPVSFRSDSTYLITGGVGGLGLKLVQWMVKHRARHLILLSRKGASDATMEALRNLEKAGVQIVVAKADVSDEERLAEFFDKIRESMPPLRGIFHLAGVIDDSVLIQQEWSRFARTIAPKVEGAWNLHVLTQDLPLDFFVLFTSTSSLFGPPGQGNYSAGNAFQDALAYYRSSHGLPVLNVNWGAWSSVGMVASRKLDSLLSSQGMGTITPQEGLEILGWLLLQKHIIQVGVMKVDWPKLIKTFSVRSETPFLTNLAEKKRKDEVSSVQGSEFIDQLWTTSTAQRQELLENYLKQKLSELLHVEIEEIPIDADFFQLGLDSLLFLQLSQVVEKDLKIKIDTNKAFENPYIQALAKRLADDTMSSSESETVSMDVVRALGDAITPDPDNQYEPFDLTSIQHAYWLGRSGIFELGNISCHFYFETEQEGLDIKRFNLAWQEVIKRHGMLRAIILPDGRQHILEHVPPYQAKVMDLRGKFSDVIKSYWESVRHEMSHQVFPADQWPMFEIRASLLDHNRVRLHISLDLLIVDVLSVQIIFEDLSQLIQDPEIHLQPLKISFRDYVQAETALRNTDLYQRSREYWLNLLPTIFPRPDLPLAKNPGSVTKPVFERRSFTLDPEAWLRLKKRASQASLTPSGILLASYAEVLSIWSKSPRLTINLTQFNRLPLHPDVMNLVGDFTSVMLMPVDRTSNNSFEARANLIQKQLWNSLEYRYFSGVEAMREIAREQGRASVGSNMPIVFTSILGVGQKTQENFQWAALGDVVYLVSQTPQVWLDNQISEQNGSLFVNWDAVEELFPEGLLDDMFDAYCRLLRRLADDEKAWYDSKPQLIPNVQLKKRAKVNATEAPISSDMLHILFATQIPKQAEQPAVVSYKKTLSYKELWHHSNQLGHLLREKGAKPNSLIAIVMEKGWEQVVAALGILNSGAAYLPIDSSSPKERAWHLLENGKVSLVLTQSWLEEESEWPEGIERFSIDKLDFSEDIHPLYPVQRPEDLAYVIYTSGSTGLPKGVMIDHRGAVNTILDINRRFAIGSEDKILALSNLNFDLSVYDIFGTLAAGGTIVLPDATRTRDPAHWVELMTHKQVTVWNSVPALMQMLVEYASGRTEVVPQSLRLVLLSGDWIPLDLPDKIKTLVKDVQIISLGGATEASIWSNLYSIEKVDPNWKSIPYGRPMVNQRFYVLNELMEDCPDWVPGHLYIGGIGLAKGYWQDEEKTRGSFIIHPQTGERLYRTGDLGRYLPDGNIEFLGREDFQVKIRGHRIELGEIEATLKQHLEVHDAVVTAVGDPQGEKHLIGYVVGDEEQLSKPAALSTFLSKKLPGYMIPSDFIVLKELPLTSTGKVDRKILPLPDRELPEKRPRYIPPKDEIESEMIHIWEDMLKFEPIGVEDDFFELGGHSVTAVRLVNEIQKSFQHTISINDLFEKPTVSHLADVVRKSGNIDSWSPLVAIQPKGSRRPFFCVPGPDGYVLKYKVLSDYLGSDQPLYGLEPRGLDGRQKPFSNIEEMAAHYIEALLKVQEEGPYFIGGFCVGTYVSFEMARQLSDAGHEIGLLVLIDPIPAGIFKKLLEEQEELSLGVFLQFHISQAQEAPQLVELEGKTLDEQLATCLAVVPEDRGITFDLFKNMYLIHQHTLKILFDYSPLSASIPTVMFPAEGFPEEWTDDWEKQIEGRLKVINILGEHGAVFFEKDRVQLMAQYLKELFDNPPL